MKAAHPNSCVVFFLFLCVLSGFLTDSERFNLVLVPKVDIYFTLTAWANCGVRLNERRLAPAISDCLTIRKKNDCLSVYKVITSHLIRFGRRGGLMVSALDSGSGGPGSSPGRGTALCSWARYFTPIVPLSTQVYKWVPA